jgi:hypothetical protein
VDGEHFDAVIRHLHVEGTRRGVLGALAGLLGLSLGDAAQASQGKGPRPGRCGQQGQPCKWNKQCCEFAGLVCINGSCGCVDDAACTGDQVCANGVCCSGKWSDCEHDADCCSGICDLYFSGAQSPICLVPCNPELGPDGGCNGASEGPDCCDFGGQFACGSCPT